MNFGMSDTIDKILFAEIDSMSMEEQNTVLRQELEAAICEKYELLSQITLLQSQISKLSDNRYLENINL